MKYADEFLNPAVVHRVAQEISRVACASRTYRLKEFCRTHAHAIFRFGLHELLTQNLEFVHGPGCPLCVLPAPRIDLAIMIAIQERVILCTVGNVLRVPGAYCRSLLSAKAEGADVRMVYSPMDALEFAVKNPERIVVFFGCLPGSQ